MKIKTPAVYTQSCLTCGQSVFELERIGASCCLCWPWECLLSSLRSLHEDVRKLNMQVNGEVSRNGNT